MSSETLLLLKLTLQQKHNYINFFENQALYKYINIQCLLFILFSQFKKVNFDEALFAKENKAGLGIIIYNDDGLVMVALTQQIPLPASIEMVEMLVAHRAL